MAQGLRERIIGIVTAGADSGAVRDRAAYNLPKTTAAKVSAVTQASKCTIAAQHFLASTAQTPAPSDTLRFLYLKIGSSRLVVSEVSIRPGPPGLVVVFDSKWRELTSVAY